MTEGAFLGGSFNDDTTLMDVKRRTNWKGKEMWEGIFFLRF